MIEVLAPAKINLGLEILGRRADGYHDIRSVMVPVSLFDRVRVATGNDRLRLGGLPSEASGNLVCAALEAARRQWSVSAVDITLSKRIPLASGLGGGSSDAAATLLGLAALAGRSPSLVEVTELAAVIGSDVPFFLRAVPSLVSGRGEAVHPLSSPPPIHAVLAVPDVAIPNKTASMYAGLQPSDLTDGSQVDAVSAALPTLATWSEPLVNAFRRPLYQLRPDIRRLACRIEEVTGLPSNLSGAGPAHVLLCRDGVHAMAVAARLRSALPRPGLSIHAVRSVAGIQLREVPDVR